MVKHSISHILGKVGPSDVKLKVSVLSGCWASYMTSTFDLGFSRLNFEIAAFQQWPYLRNGSADWPWTWPWLTKVWWVFALVIRLVTSDVSMLLTHPGNSCDRPWLFGIWTMARNHFRSLVSCDHFSCDQAALWMVQSVCPSITPFWLCSHHRIIMKFSGVITNDRSDVHAKGQGQRSRSQRSTPNLAVSGP